VLLWHVLLCCYNMLSNSLCQLAVLQSTLNMISSIATLPCAAGCGVSPAGRLPWVSPWCMSWALGSQSQQQQQRQQQRQQQWASLVTTRQGVLTQ
jgi:hypothetical protein